MYDVDDNTRSNKLWKPYEDKIVREEYYSACRGRKKPPERWEFKTATRLQRSPQGVRARMCKHLLPLDEGRLTYDEERQKREAAVKTIEQKNHTTEAAPQDKRKEVTDLEAKKLWDRQREHVNPGQGQADFSQIIIAVNEGFAATIEAITKLTSVVEEAWTDKE